MFALSFFQTTLNFREKPASSVLLLLSSRENNTLSSAKTVALALRQKSKLPLRFFKMFEGRDEVVAGCVLLEIIIIVVKIVPLVKSSSSSTSRRIIVRRVSATNSSSSSSEGEMAIHERFVTKLARQFRPLDDAEHRRESVRVDVIRGRFTARFG